VRLSLDLSGNKFDAQHVYLLTDQIRHGQVFPFERLSLQGCRLGARGE
jgi:hypothetical protein